MSSFTRTHRAPQRAIAVTAVVAVAAVLAPAGVSSAASGSGDGQGLRPRTQPTKIIVHAKDPLTPLSKGLFGVNQQFDRNGHGLWSIADDAPRRSVVRAARRSQVRSVRFPGGTMANLYDWKRAIGKRRGCQVDAAHAALAKGQPARAGKAYGPDEFMQFVEAIDAKPFVMVPMVTETPDDAADWVEYMNSPAGTRSNPNGGTDWADVRAANGHAEPYHVVRWEMGNELHHPRSRHWLSPDTPTAIRQYAFGGSKLIAAENVGRSCRHPQEGVPSNGARRQTFEVLYPPVDPTSLAVTVAGEPWTPVADFGAATRTDHVYVLDAENGRVSFGNGRHGAIPAAGGVVTASYRSIHAGYFKFVAAMHAVDPHIKVCASWGSLEWPRTVKRREYDCLTRHSITTFQGRSAHWEGRLEAHDRLMVATGMRRLGYTDLRSALPDDAALWISEMVNMQGDVATWPQWQASASAAAYTASLWGDWIELGVPVVIADDLIRDRPGLLGGPPGFHTTARALTRRAVAPLIDSRGWTVRCPVREMPVRDGVDDAGSYAGLAVTCVRGRDKTLFVMVVNRLPKTTVKARLDLRDFVSARRAGVTRVRGADFTSTNEPDAAPGVSLTTSRIDSARDGFKASFPPASTTVYRLAPR